MQALENKQDSMPDEPVSLAAKLTKGILYRGQVDMSLKKSKECAQAIQEEKDLKSAKQTTQSRIYP